MKRIKTNKIVVHCSATEQGKDFKFKDIDRWHKANGWKGCGYHFIIDLDGTVENGRPLEDVGAHCRQCNRTSVGICYIGGLKHGKAFNTLNKYQETSLINLIYGLKEKYPNATIHGHNEFAPKACPCFDVQEWIKGIL